MEEGTLFCINLLIFAIISGYILTCARVRDTELFHVVYSPFVEKFE